jgi:O-glycosyl hydrolase
MQGFGGAEGFYTGWLTGHPYKDEIYDLIFAQLGLQVLRIGNWYQNTGPSAFSDDVAIVQAARASLGHDPLVLLSSWSPPASLKSNGMTKMGGTLAQDSSGAYRYADFGQWWAASLSAYAAMGVNPAFISIQNEPDYVAPSWEMCLFDPTENATNAGYDQALAAVTAALPSTGITPLPEVIGPETSGIAAMRVESYVDALQAGPGLDLLGGIAHHLYNGGSQAVPSSFDLSMTDLAGVGASSGKPLLMTEYGAQATMLATAWLINDAVTVEGVSAYFIWSLTWPPPAAGSAPGGLVSIENPFTKMPFQLNAKGYAVNDQYYAVRHFSKWIDVGWQRVGATSPASAIKVSAFVSPDGTQATLVLLNGDGQPHSITVDPGSFAFGTSAVYRSSGTDERTMPIGPLAGPIDMPAQAIATVTLAP